MRRQEGKRVRQIPWVLHLPADEKVVVMNCSSHKVLRMAEYAGLRHVAAGLGLYWE